MIESCGCDLDQGFTGFQRSQVLHGNFDDIRSAGT
jgi:hypothetical protein